MERMEEICVLQTQIEFKTKVRKQFDCLLLRIRTEHIKKVFVCMFLWYFCCYITRPDVRGFQVRRQSSRKRCFSFISTFFLKYLANISFNPKMTQ